MKFYQSFLQPFLPVNNFKKVQHIDTSNMEPSYEEYAAVLKSFYQKVLKSHPEYLKLNRDFGQIIKQFATQQVGRSRNKPVQRDQDEISASGSGKSASKSGTRSQRSFRSNMKPSKSEYLFSSKNLGRIVVFSFLYYLIETSNKPVFEMIDTKTKLLMQTISDQKIKQIDQDPSKSAKIWEKNHSDLKKIMNLLSHKAKVRWEKILKDTFSELHQIFIQIFLRAILNLSVTSSSNLSILSPDDLDKISKQLKISFLYFEYENNQISQKVQYGDFKYELRIGYVKAEEKYAFFDKLPNDQNKPNLLSNKSWTNHIRKQSIKQQNIPDLSKNESGSISSDIPRKTTILKQVKRKAQMSIKSILGEYETNTKRLEDLECLNVQTSKQGKIKRLLEESRRRRQS